MANLPIKYEVNDVVVMKKAHPCGGFEWKILKVGVDFRLECLTCGRVVMITRLEAQKRIKCKK